jgi:hypothetical protein
MSKLSSDGHDSGSKKFKRGYVGTKGGVWQSLVCLEYGVMRLVLWWCFWQKPGSSRREDVFMFYKMLPFQCDLQSQCCNNLYHCSTRTRLIPVNCAGFVNKHCINSIWMTYNTSELLHRYSAPRYRYYKTSRYKSEERVHTSFYSHCCHPLYRYFRLQNGEL